MTSSLKSSSPILFLDVDGVLNSRPWRCSRARRALPGADPMSLEELEAVAESELDPELVARLAWLVLEHDARIVLSSSWRRLISVADLELALEHAGARFDPALAMISGARPAESLRDRRAEASTALARGERCARPFLGRMVGSTGSRLCRAEEIADWLRDHNRGPAYGDRVAIVDDADLATDFAESGAPELAGMFVRTDDDLGLTEGDAFRLSQLLRDPRDPVPAAR